MLTKGEQKIILFLYNQVTQVRDSLTNNLEELGASKEVAKEARTLLDYSNFSVPLKLVRNAGIYKYAKIYPALSNLKKSDLIVVHNRPYPNYTDDLRGKILKELSEKKYRKVLRKDLEKADPNDFPFLEFIGKKAGIELDKSKLKEYTTKILTKTVGEDGNQFENGIRFLKDSGLLWYPNQKFVYLTPDGMFLGRILQRSS